MRKKLAPSDIRKLKISDIIYAKPITHEVIPRNHNSRATIKKGLTFEFYLREDNALLISEKGKSVSSNTNSNVFKIKSGLKYSQDYRYKWVRKRTAYGYIMGLLRKSGEWSKLPNDFIEVFNELDIKILRAARDSAIRKKDKALVLKNTKDII
jgi:ribosomal protein S18 acetylase RimI-like enzyme